MGTEDDSATAPVDHDVLEDARSYLVTSDRFGSVEAEPGDGPGGIRCYFDTGFYPHGVDDAYLDVRWYRNGDFSIHYRELYSDGNEWECRWDRHPNDHNDRAHYHPGPDAARADAADESYPDDWRDVLQRVLTEIDERTRAFW